MVRAVEDSDSDIDEINDVPTPSSRAKESKDASKSMDKYKDKSPSGKERGERQERGEKNDRERLYSMDVEESSPPSNHRLHHNNRHEEEDFEDNHSIYEEEEETEMDLSPPASPARRRLPSSPTRTSSSSGHHKTTSSVGNKAVSATSPNRASSANGGSSSAPSGPKRLYRATDEEIADYWDKWDLRGNDAKGEEARKNLRHAIDRLRHLRKSHPTVSVIEAEFWPEIKLAYEEYMTVYPDGPRLHRDHNPDAPSAPTTTTKSKKSNASSRKSQLKELYEPSKRSKIFEYPLEVLGDKALEIRNLYLQLQATASQASAFLAQIAVTEKAVQNMLRNLEEHDLE